MPNTNPNDPGEDDDFLNDILNEIDESRPPSPSPTSPSEPTPITQPTLQNSTASSSSPTPSPVSTPSTTVPVTIPDPREELSLESTSTSVTNINAFLYDIKPDPTSSSRVILYAKVHSSSLSLPSNQYITVSFVVSNLNTVLYFIRRQFLISDPNCESTITDKPASYKECITEIHQLKKRAGIQEIKTKEVSKKLIPGLVNFSNVTPDSLNCIKVKYCANRKLSDRISGRSFCHVSGGNATNDHKFILKKKIRGPVWMVVKQAKLVNIKRKIPCYIIDDHKKIEIDNLTKREIPKFNVGIINIKQNLKTCFYMSLTDFPQYNIQTPDWKTAVDKFLVNTISYVYLPPTKSANISGGINNNLAAKEGLTIYSKKRGMNIKIFTNLSQMIYSLVNYLSSKNIDVLIGYDLLENTLSFLISSLNNKRHKTSNIFSRSPIITKSSSTNYNKKNKVLYNFEGRLLVDSFILTKEFANLTTYSISEIASQICDIQLLTNFNLVNNLELDTDLLTIAKTQKLLINSNTRRLEPIIETYLDLVNKNVLVGVVSFFILLKLNIFPLTFQLSIQCGCKWQDSLLVKRALRTDFLLSHEFRAHNYLLPEHNQNPTKLTGGKTEKFSGGLVLEPKIGFYSNNVLLLDFNSLYPSIIVEYNLCFSSLPLFLSSPHPIETPEQLKSVITESTSNFVTNDNKSTSKSGTAIIPLILTKILEQRTSIKNTLKSLMTTNKDSKNNQLLKEQLVIQQKALKLTANSLYGSLGYKNSLFYCPSIPALVTFSGRTILQDTVERTNAIGKGSVIYGDTDSVMISTTITDNNQLLSYASQIKNTVNMKYKNIYLELESVFLKLLILKKKKYAALKLDSLNITNSNENNKKLAVKEYKGLDLVRRDNCPLVKKISENLLTIILNENSDNELSTQNLHLEIFGVLEKLVENLKSGRISYKDFLITKSITKSLEFYPDPENVPHVFIAKRLVMNGINVGVGKHISFIICEGEGKLAYKAFTYEEFFERKKSVDISYYIKHQIFPPVLRLLTVFMQDHIANIHNIFGIPFLENTSLNATNFSRDRLVGISDDADGCKFSEYFSDEGIEVGCPKCKIRQNWKGIQVENLKESLACKNKDCEGFFNYNQLPQLKLEIGEFIGYIFSEFKKKLVRIKNEKYYCKFDGCDFENNINLVIFNDKKRNHKCGSYMEQGISEDQGYKYFEGVSWMTDLEMKELELGKELEIEEKNENVKVVFKVLNSILKRISEGVRNYGEIEIGENQFDGIY